MRRGHLNAEAPLGLLGETHSVGRRECNQSIMYTSESLLEFAAPTISPKAAEAPPLVGAGSNIYRQDSRPQQQFFDLDLDLNPDL